MAPTEAAAPHPLGVDALPGCLALSTEAGWNQTAEDWAVFLARGTVFGITGRDGVPVASSAVLPFSDEFAWISMVLVTAARRGEGHGTRLLEACIAEAARRGWVPLLDATPAGERIYRPLGFRPLFGLTRWEGRGAGAATVSPRIRRVQAHDLPAIAASDRRVFGGDRAFLLGDLLRRAPGGGFRLADGSGFVLTRPGRLALQIGPLVAESEADALRLLEAAVDAADGPVLLDVNDRWADLRRWLDRRGFVVQRPFLRMALGRDAPFGSPKRLFAAAGPEFG